MVNFLILISKYTDITKKEIDIGEISLSIYSLCSIIRECFCLSYSIRKENNLVIYFSSSKILIKFEGNQLRFLGSDERSQAILIEKALKKVNERSNLKWENSTPGIFTKKTENQDSILYELGDWINDRAIYIVNDKDTMEVESLEKQISLKDFSYIIPSPNISLDFTKFKYEFKNSKKQIKFVSLPKIKKIENKVSFINFKIDQQKN